MTSTDPDAPHVQEARGFAEALVGGRFDEAHSMLSQDLQRAVSVEDLQSAYESMVEYGTGPVEVDEPITSMEEWPDKRPDDVGWAYVSISGTDFAEAVTVVVANEEGQLKIRELEWGRP